ncbi:shikimate dehydrogenase [Subtercola sp. Z020]|nr:shikimate dehydrogenase [Subtercola sp. Z020]
MTEREARARLRLAVLGSPIEHSKSPALHAAAYRVLGFEADYGSAEVGRGMLGAFVDRLDGTWRGLSLTMPLKEEAAPLLDAVDRNATLTGAVNTVLFRGRGQREGFNTDVAGIVHALGDAGVQSARSVLVLGAGATARSVVVAAANLGAESVVIAARSEARATASVEVAHAAGLRARSIPLADALGGIVDAPVTISTLPGGALEESDVTHVRPGEGSVLLDVAYAPWPSPLGATWQANGAVVVSGLLMLVHQALVQVRIFVQGDPELALPDEAEVLAAMLGAVGLPG